MNEDKQKSIREKILKDIELKEQQKKLKAKERYEKGKDAREEERLLKVNAFKKAKQKKWEEIKDWRQKMKKAGIKAKPRKYYKPPRDLSIHTHSKCKVPALAKRKGE